MWSRKPTPVRTSAWPVPSRSSVSSIFVSAVWRRMVAVRAMKLAFQADIEICQAGKPDVRCLSIVAAGWWSG